MQNTEGIQTLNVKVSSQKKRKVSWSLAPYLWLLPSIVLIVLLIVYPVLQLFIVAFSKMDLAGISHGFNGLRNFVNLFHRDSFMHTIGNTLIWTAAIVGISTVISLGVAPLLNQDFPGRKILRAALIIPWAASVLITAFIWKWIFDYHYGTLNLLLQRLHLVNHNIYWLATYKSSFPSMIWIGIFCTIPFTTFVFLAGLQTIPNELYEAAEVDGAHAWQKFIHITLPSLKYSLMVSSVLNTIYVFNSFPVIWAITQGGPANSTQTLVTYLYTLAFQVNSMGQAAAASVISFLLLLVFSLIYGLIVMRGE